jgi:hypothetical protein
MVAYEMIARRLVLAGVLGVLLAPGCQKTETEQKFSDYRGGGKGNEPWGGKTKEQYLKEQKAANEAGPKAAAAAKKAAEERKKADAEKKAEAKRLEDEQKRAAAATCPPATVPVTAPATVAAPATPVPLPKVTASAAPALLPAVPAAITDWKMNDYFAARLAGDPRLLPAVQRLAKDSVGDDSAVRIFASLLVPQASAAGPQAAVGNGPDAKNRSAPLLEAATAGLAMNQTPGARQVLILLLSGLYPTDDDAAGAFAAIKALAEHPSDENDDLLLRVLTSAEQFRPAGRGTVAADALRAKTVALLGPAAGSGLRMKIACWLVQPDSPPALRGPLVSLLREPSPVNFSAQVCLEQNGVLPGEACGPIEKGLAGASSDAFGLLAGLSTAAAAERDPKWAGTVAGQLWSREFAAALTARLPQIESLRGTSPLMLLAGTLPNDTVRGALYQTLGKHWEDNPAALGAAAGDLHTWYEPGFTVLVKLYYRRSFPTPDTGEVQLVRTRQLAGERTLAAKRYAVWMQNGLAIINRLAALPGGTRPVVHGATSASKMPVTIDAPQDVVLEYHLDWPSAMRDTLPGLRLDPLSVHYVKIEEKARPSKIVAHYRRALKLGDRVKFPEKGKQTEVHDSAAKLWFDHLSVGSTPDRTRSLDIIIRAANPELPMMHDQERRMIVEILSIEINDPSRRENGKGPS